MSNIVFSNRGKVGVFLMTALVVSVTIFNALLLSHPASARDDTSPNFRMFTNFIETQYLQIAGWIKPDQTKYRPEIYYQSVGMSIFAYISGGVHKAERTISQQIQQSTKGKTI